MVFKKISLFMASLCLFVSSGSATASAVQLTPSELEWLNEHPKITVGHVPDWAPFSMLGKNGEPDGVAGSYKKLLEKAIPIHFDPAPEAPWEEVLGRVRDKKIDVIILLGRTPERE